MHDKADGWSLACEFGYRTFEMLMSDAIQLPGYTDRGKHSEVNMSTQLLVCVWRSGRQGSADIAQSLMWVEHSARTD